MELSDGSARTVDHLLFGTGYRVDIHRYPFLDPALVLQIRSVGGYPVLRPGMESSVPGLHFLGAPAARMMPTVPARGWQRNQTLTPSISL